MGNIIKKLMSHMMAYFAFVHLKMELWAIPWPGIHLGPYLHCFSYSLSNRNKVRTVHLNV